MFFKHIVIFFVVLGILGFIYGDRIFYFQARLMMSWQYDFPAYEAFERIIHYYPQSPHRAEAKKMLEILPKRNSDLRNYLKKRDSQTQKMLEDQARKEAYH